MSFHQLLQMIHTQREGSKSLLGTPQEVPQIMGFSNVDQHRMHYY